MRLKIKRNPETEGRVVPEDDRSRDPDPFLFRLAKGIESVVGVLTAEFGFVVPALLLAIVLGVSLIGLLLEFLLGAACLISLALLAWFFSDVD